ncbi:MAG: helix-turn-helix domain-containing protein [Candidatus Micrarchaeota archaeon]
MDTESLENIGLTKGETNVYLALLETGATTTGKLIKNTGLQKSTVYFCLEQLIEKGLVGHVIKNNRKVFEAGSPTRLRDYIEKKKMELAKQEEKIEQLIPFLSGKMKPQEKHESAKIFEGWNGMETAFDDIILNAGKKEYLIFAVSPLPTVAERFRRFIRKFHQKRTKAKIRTLVLVNEEFIDTLGKDREKEARTTVNIFQRNSRRRQSSMYTLRKY